MNITIMTAIAVFLVVFCGLNLAYWKGKCDALEEVDAMLEEALKEDMERTGGEE